MDREQSLALAERLGPPNEGLRPSMEFMLEMWSRFGVELRALVGRSALERPYGEQQLTIAEQFFRESLHAEGIFTADLMEVNRTVMNVAVERALLDPDPIWGSYEVITDCQKNPDTRLTPETHDWMRSFTLDVLHDWEEQQIMETGLMGADIGKSKVVIEDMATRGKIYADHDRLLVELLEDPETAQRWFPSWCLLSPRGQQKLLNIYRSEYHMPQDLQGESPASKWVAFQKLTLEEQRFGLLLGLLDISGAQGDRIQNGSMTLTEPVVTAFRALVEAHMAPAPPGFSEQEAALYKNGLYLQFRGSQMGLTLEQPNDQALIRLCCNLNYSRPEQAAFLQDVMANEMQPEDRQNLLELLSYTGFESEGHAWIMYLPALITRYKEKLQEKGEPPRAALDAALTLAARTYAAAKEQIDLSPGIVIVAGDLVRAFEQDPRLPLTHRIRIDSVSPTEANASFEPISA